MNKVSKIPIFDDFLGLKNEKFQGVEMIIFSGTSGSGKSSYLSYLEQSHPYFQDIQKRWIWTMHRPIKFSLINQNELLLIDEIISPRQLLSFKHARGKGISLAIASHINPIWYHILFPLSKKRFFQTDKGVEKLRRWLKQKNVPYSNQSLHLFQKKYGSNYVDLNCLLERSSKKNLDYALNMHSKMDSIKVESCKHWTPCTPSYKFE